MSGSHLSKDFFELVKAIGESKSKQEEDRIIIQEVATLKRKCVEADVSKKKMKELLIRLLYVEMLGHDASFGYIKAVEFTASTNLLQKRVGYLTASLTLSPEHEFRFMLINQLQRDLKSANHLESCAALTTVVSLVNIDMIPAVLPIVTDLLRHDTELVRKKAVMTLQRFHQLSPETVLPLGKYLAACS
jgi:AP-4 complex subunit epsilon-1